jgi:hypothetical protein
VGRSLLERGDSPMLLFFYARALAARVDMPTALSTHPYLVAKELKKSWLFYIRRENENTKEVSRDALPSIQRPS